MSEGVLSNAHKYFSSFQEETEAKSEAVACPKRASRGASLRDLASAITPPNPGADLGLDTKTNEVCDTTEQDMAQDMEKNKDDEVVADTSSSRRDSSTMSVDSGIATPPISNSKGVSFAPSPARKSSAQDNNGELDALMGPDDLLKTLKEVRTSLDQARVDLSAEKAIRKRKEKNLVKLAKQLNMRASTIEEQTKQIESLVSSAAKLETRLETARRDLEEMSERHERASREHHAEITAQQTKHRDLCRKHDDRISEMTASHGRQCEELRREILTAKLDADRLRMQLASAEMERNPDGASAVIERTIKESMSTAKISSGIMKYVFIAVGLFMIPLFAVGYQRDLLSMDALCAPCVPGTTLGDGAPSTYDAPWWVPASSKATAFGLLCGARPRTRLEWSGGTGVSKVIVIDLDNKSSRNRLLEKRVLSAALTSDRIEFTNNNGKTEISAPWKI